jgi:hypothetical protein
MAITREELREAASGRWCRQQALLQVGEQFHDARLRRIAHVSVLHQVLLVGVADTQ